MQTSLWKSLAVGAALVSPMAMAATGIEASLTDGISPKESCHKADLHKAASARCDSKKVFETFKATPVDTKLPETARVDATAGVFI